MSTSFPKLIVDPDSYPCEVYCGDRVVPGMAELLADAPPRIHMYGEFVDRSDMLPRLFPERDEAEMLVGRLSSGHDLILGDCRVQTLLPGRSIVFPRYALVGLNLGTVTDQAYEELVVQATGLDLLFGCPPLKSVPLPHRPRHFLEGEFVATGEPRSRQEWVDTGATLTCSYWAQQSPIDNPYRFELRFAPVVTVVESDQPKRVDDWVGEFVTPLMRLHMCTSTEGKRRGDPVTANPAVAVGAVKMDEHLERSQDIRP